LSFTLRIVGEGPLRDELEALTEKLELSHAVRFLGEASYSRVEEIYRESDVFWHTGIVALNGDRDGLPNVIPEAFLHGVPVIATDLPGSNEAVRHGVSGWVVSRPQSQDLASAVVELLSDEVLRAKVIEGGHEWVRTHFNLAQNIRPLAQAFRDTLSRERE
jgi:glycosyltransferase involved in cell wall biosynthesis